MQPTLEVKEFATTTTWTFLYDCTQYPGTFLVIIYLTVMDVPPEIMTVLKNPTGSVDFENLHHIMGM